MASLMLQNIRRNVEKGKGKMQQIRKEFKVYERLKVSDKKDLINLK